MSDERGSNEIPETSLPHTLICQCLTSGKTCLRRSGKRSKYLRTGNVTGSK